MSQQYDSVENAYQLFLMENYEKCVMLLEEIKDKIKDNGRGLALLGKCYIKLHDYSKGLTYLNKAKKYEGYPDDLYYVVAQTYVDLATDRAKDLNNSTVMDYSAVMEYLKKAFENIIIHLHYNEDDALAEDLKFQLEYWLYKKQ